MCGDDLNRPRCCYGTPMMRLLELWTKGVVVESDEAPSATLLRLCVFLVVKSEVSAFSQVIQPVILL